jgi:plastocyanin
MHKNVIVLTAVALVFILALPGVGLAGPPDEATMLFGRPDLGSGCNFPCEDDASFHAVDKIQPGSVAISAGGTVYFDIEGFHQVAIYEPGIAPKDIEPTGFPFVDDEDGRIFLGAPLADTSYTFDEPGKYLVICNVTPHFEEAQMWGWVIVN